MISLQLILATALFGSLGESRFIVDLTHTFDKDATKYPLGIFGITNFTYFDHWKISEAYYESNQTDNKMWWV